MAMLAVSSSMTSLPGLIAYSSAASKSNSCRSVRLAAGSSHVASRNTNLRAKSGFLTGSTLLLPKCGNGARLQLQPARRTVAPRAAAAAGNEGLKTLAVAVAIPLVAGIVDSIFNSPGTEWYLNLRKPKWQPPSFLFGGAWSVLYPLIGVASWLVWAEGGFAKQSYPLTIYGIQLALNLAWPALFFGAKKLGAAFVDIVILDVAVIATIIAFKPVSELAANLLKPYLGWCLFATALNYSLWQLNKGPSEASSASSPAPAS